MIRKILIIYSISFIIFLSSCNNQTKLPLEQNNYKTLTTNQEIQDFIKLIESREYISVKNLVQVKSGKIIQAVYIGDSSKLKTKVLVIAQQHGNEASGKEGILYLLRDFYDGNNLELLDSLQLIIIPQLNPDGGDDFLRRNAEDIDLNRDHVLLETDENKALRKLFFNEMPDIVIDVHEYYPFTNSWREIGYHKNFDEQVGFVTNLNINKKIRIDLKNKALPYIEKYITDGNFSFTQYKVGHILPDDRLRFSTVDINDARQSAGIFNTFSFIIEGLRDSVPEGNIKHRSLGQKRAVEAIFKFAYQNNTLVKSTVKEAQQTNSDSIILRMEHYSDGSVLDYQLKAFGSDKDSIFKVENYHPIIKPLLKIKRPTGYLIPKNDKKLLEFIKNHQIKTSELSDNNNHNFIAYKIIELKKDTIEELESWNPILEKEQIEIEINNYYYISAKSVYSNFLCLSFEPQSMSGLVQYGKFNYLLTENEYYPILRVEKQ